jgi:uncharacterized protein YpmS
MTDIPGLIERLRHQAQRYEVIPPVASRDMSEAADALSRLSEDKKRLEEALQSYLATCTNDECVYCIAARSALRGE